MSDTTEQHPRNFQAILDWCERFRPDLGPVILAEKNNDAFITLMTVGFEAGRTFQHDYPDFPMDQSHLYQPENNPGTVAPLRPILKWLPLDTPNLASGKYIVAHRGYAEIDTYLSPNDTWMPGAKIGWQEGDPVIRFHATHCALLPDVPEKEGV